MSRPRLSSPSQTPLVRGLLRLYEFAASLRMAVVLIFTSAFTLGLGTFVEAAYGTPAVQFYVYRTWWFELLLVLLAINIFCAAAIRYPWKRHQTGFVITHIGLLTLLFGAFFGRYRGIDAQISIFEGRMEKWAIESDLKLHLTVHDVKSSSLGAPPKPIEVKFRPGLFNWADMQEQFRFTVPGDEKLPTSSALPWKSFRWFSGQLFKLAGQNRPGDVLYNRDGVKLEVLDFYGDSQLVNAPYVKMFISTPPMERVGGDGKLRKIPGGMQPMELVLQDISRPEYPFGLSEKQPMGGGAFTFQLAGSDAQTEAFLKCGPEGALGTKGQAVIFIDGKAHRISIDERLKQGRFALAGGKYEAEVVDYYAEGELTKVGDLLDWKEKVDGKLPNNPTVKIAIYEGTKRLNQLVLVALDPHMNMQDHEHKIYGEYWFNFGDEGALTKEQRTAARITPRIDVLQGHDHKLYYRYWNREKLVFARECPTNGSPEKMVDAFKMPFGQLQLYVKEFVPSDKPALIPLKKPVVKAERVGVREPAAKLALTIGEKREEFWLLPYMNFPDTVIPPGQEPPFTHFSLRDSRRMASIVMPLTCIEIGQKVRLNKFEHKLDPGTDQPSHYSSWVDLVDERAERSLATLPAKGSAPQIFPNSRINRPTNFGMTPDGEKLWVASTEKSTTVFLGAMWKNWQLPSDKPGGGSLDSLGEKQRRLGAILVADHEVIYAVERVPLGRTERGSLLKIEQNQTTRVVDFTYLPEALALDAKHGHLYFAGRGKNSIGRVDLAAATVKEDWFSAAKRPTSLTLDAAEGQLFWTEAGKPTIQSLSLKGISSDTLVEREENEQPLEVAINRKGDRLYFFESYPRPAEDASKRPNSKPLQWRLMSVATSGGEPRVECDRQIDEPHGLAFDQDDKPVWTQTSLLRDDAWVTMNAPIDCYDPSTGRSYRIYQESFEEALKPGDKRGGVRFEDIVAPDSAKTQLFRSVLTVNYDPGRGIRNIGCLLICLGIALMFYMRAYFFKPKGRIVVQAEIVAPAKSPGKKRRPVKT